MKKTDLTLAFLAGLILAGLATPAAAASTCLRLRDIRDAQAPDGKTLVVTLNNGKVYNNKLIGSCSELKWQGFVWVTHNDQVCDRENTLRVINSGQTCQLGVFVPAPPKAKPHHSAP